MMSHQHLRQHSRRQRQQLSPPQRQRANSLINQHLSQFPPLQTATHWAAYVALSEEVDLTALLHQLPTAPYLPVIDHKQLQFRQWPRNSPLVPNRFGIGEPPPDAPHIAPEQLHLVLVPLVGFDVHGHRLGMGGGFYDRTFAFRMAKSISPLLLGVAFECQKLPPLSPQPWDIPLDGVATELGLYRTGEFTPWPSIGS